MKYYAVARGRNPGIYTDWETTKVNVDGFPGAIHKSFSTYDEAIKFINSYNQVPPVHPVSSVPPVHPVQIHSKIVYTDGSCTNHQGGYAVISIDGDKEDVEYGPVPIFPCTNQKAELYAILRALQINSDDNLIIRTDSMYSKKAVTEWIYTWMRNGWITSNKTPVENRELIEDIYKLLQQRKHVSIEHVYGHKNDHYNNMADTLANKGRLMNKPL